MHPSRIIATSQNDLFTFAYSLDGKGDKEYYVDLITPDEKENIIINCKDYESAEDLFNLLNSGNYTTK